MDPESGEQVIFHGHPSWLSMLGFHLKGLLAAVVVGVLAGLVSAVVNGKVQSNWVIVAVLIVFVVVLGRGAFVRAQTTYTITDRRLTIQRGLLSREVHETRLERVQNVALRQSLLERFVGVGTLDFDTAGSAEFDFTFTGVEDPRELAREVDGALHELQRPGARLA